jgi:hypothetical protein
MIIQLKNYSNIIQSFTKKVWHDPVWSKIIAVAILALLGALYRLWFIHSAVVPPAPLITNNITRSELSTPPLTSLTPDMLNNLTYQIEEYKITLKNGKYENKSTFWKKREGWFSGDLTNYALGDLDGDGRNDAITIVAVSGGGSGYFYYLAPVFNEHGNPKVYDKSYCLGDRVDIDNLSISEGKVIVILTRYGETVEDKKDDSYGQPIIRTIEFIIYNKALVCITEPCS